MRALHFVAKDKIQSILVDSLKPNMEYTVEIDEDVAVQMRMDGNSFKVVGVDWFFIQLGE